MLGMVKGVMFTEYSSGARFANLIFLFGLQDAPSEQGFPNLKFL